MSGARQALWARARRSRILLVLALVLVVAIPIYLYLVFPFIWRGQMALMDAGVSGALPPHLDTEEEFGRALFSQVMLNVVAWLAPIGLLLLTVLYLIGRVFVRSDTI